MSHVPEDDEVKEILSKIGSDDSSGKSKSKVIKNKDGYSNYYDDSKDDEVGDVDISTF